MGERVKNIGAEGQRKRLTGGLIAMAVGLAGAIFLIASHLSRWWRVLLLIPFWQGALGVFQALENT